MIDTQTKTEQRPTWWTEQHATAWSRIREAVRRDWEQTKHDISNTSGHELNQDIGSTVLQSIDRQPIPPGDRPNPPRIIGDWEDIELPISFGYAACHVYGAQHPVWSSELEGLLKRDWIASHAPADQGWGDAKRWVRQGYEGIAKGAA